MIHISYEQTEADIAEVTARSLSAKAKAGYVLWAIIGVLSMFVSAWLWDHDALPWLSWVPFFAGFGLCLGVANATASRRAKQLSQFLSKAAYEAEIDDSGVKSSRPGVRMEFEWSVFREFWETKNLFALHYGATYFAFPKRAFTPEQLAEFRELLARKIPQKK